MYAISHGNMDVPFTANGSRRYRRFTLRVNRGPPRPSFFMNFVTALFCPPPSSVPAPPTATLSPPPFPPTPGILGSFSPLPFFFSAGAATALLTRTPSSAAAASAAPDAAAAARGDAASSSAPIPIAARSRSSAI